MEEIRNFIIEYGIATKEEINLVTTINGYTEESLNDIIYAREGYRSMNQYLGIDDEE